MSPQDPMAPRRARSIAEFAERMAHFVSSEGLAYALAFRPRGDDVIIATYPKAGTTWMQQIVHGLRTGGDMDFAEISAVVPWIELAHDMGIDLEAPQKAAPRAFKTHWNGEQMPREGRYIVVIRDPRDTMVSFYRFMEGWFLEPGAVSADDFAAYLIDRDHPAGSYWQHLKTWWARRQDDNVLMLAFEDLLADLAGQVRRVARFVGIEDEATIAIATRQARFDFMKAHERQFDDHLTAEARNAACGLPAAALSSKVRTGRSGGHAGTLGPAIRARLDAIWQSEIASPLGFADYAALRRVLAAEAEEADFRP
ncbi:MAG: sulfotransferase domain-containing protein [Alphaproteobacteria bacterium]|nr:MAG: sulfotransferase domain-containing protein [Alphaproteobacteria bacterium]